MSVYIDLEMKNKYTPFKGINKIHFGFSGITVREALGLGYTEIKRNAFAENSSDYYESLGFFIEYNIRDLCDAIEFTDSSNLYFDEQNLLSLNYLKLRNKYDNLSSEIEEEAEVGVTYHDLGFGLVRAFGSNKIESMIVFSKEYWL